MLNKTINLSKVLISKNNIYNVHVLPNPIIRIRFSYFTLENEKNLRFTNFFYILEKFTNLRAGFKGVETYFVKKKILKKFSFESILPNKINWYFFHYLRDYYFYFFHIYFNQIIKFNYNKSQFVVYIDNPQTFVKKLLKIKQNIRFNVFFSFRNMNYPVSGLFLNYLQENYLIKCNTNYIKQKKN